MAARGGGSLRAEQQNQRGRFRDDVPADGVHRGHVDRGEVADGAGRKAGSHEDGDAAGEVARLGTIAVIRAGGEVRDVRGPGIDGKYGLVRPDAGNGPKRQSLTLPVSGWLGAMSEWAL